MDTDGKLVRDLIPDIIRAAGVEPMFYFADATEYRSRLLDKLGEEVEEFLQAGEGEQLDELADVLEVVRALAVVLGTDPDTLEKIREAKALARGGFNRRIVWKGNR
ncbi:nucleoside triphosphate pyrophosphohydrolase [Nonomuraea wenchangensis]